MCFTMAPEDFGTWMTGDADAAAAVLTPHLADDLSVRPVSRRVNNVRSDCQACLCFGGAAQQVGAASAYPCQRYTRPARSSRPG